MVVRGSDCIKFVLKTVFCSPNISASKWPEVNKDHPFLVRTHFWNFPFFSRKLIIFVRFLFLLSKVGIWNSDFSFSSRNWGNEIHISLSPLESVEIEFRFLFLFSKVGKGNTDFSFSSRNWRNRFQISLSLLDFTFLPLVNHWPKVELWKALSFTILQ